MRVIIAIAGALALSAQTVAAPLNPDDQRTIRAFVGRLYAGYTTNGPGARGWPRLLAPELARLVALDEQQANGEAGYLDYDPICSCQDWDRITSTVIGISGDSARAVVKLSLSYGPAVSPQRPQRLTLLLQKSTRGWLIADIATPETPSLRSMLAAALAPSSGKVRR